MVETLFYDKPHRKNMKNLQTKLYLALFSDFEYLVPLQSNEIFFRISSEKTYCIWWELRLLKIRYLGPQKSLEFARSFF